MTKDLLENLRTLRAAASRLNAATDEVSATVRAVEAFLGEDLSLGIAAESNPFEDESAEYDDDSDAERTRFRRLAYGRVAGKFRIHVLETEEEWVGSTRRIVSEERIPWSSCPREVKLRAFEQLPELLGRIADKAGDLSKKVEVTSRTVREMLDSSADAVRGACRDRVG